MRYTYYPGCTQLASAKSYDVSTRAVAKALDIEIVDLEDWNCCGTSPYLSVRELPAFAIAARNLALAEKQTGSQDLLTICNACYLVLEKVNIYMRENEELREKIRETLNVVGLDYQGSVRVRHFLEVLVNDVGEETMQQKVVRKLEGLKVAPYYGCQYSRPFGNIDDIDFPTTMDTLLSWLSAEVVDYPVKAKCCGGMLMVTEKDVGLKLVKTLLTVAADREADCIATCCPLCEMNVEAYQGDVNKKFNTDFSIPAVYFTQLVGISLGLGLDEMELGKELVSAKELLSSYLQAA